MTYIKSKTMKDEDGQLFVPVTHVSAVFDGEGTPLSELLNSGRSGAANGDDIPESLGVAYALMKATEQIKVSQYIRASLPVPARAQSAGDTLVNSCYYQMFYGCTRLTSVTCLATDISANNCVYQWVSSVASSGTFYKKSTMSSWPSGVSGIPSGWTTSNYTE